MKVSLAQASQSSWLVLSNHSENKAWCARRISTSSPAVKILIRILRCHLTITPFLQLPKWVTSLDSVHARHFASVVHIIASVSTPILAVVKQLTLPIHTTPFRHLIPLKDPSIHGSTSPANTIPHCEDSLALVRLNASEKLREQHDHPSTLVKYRRVAGRTVNLAWQFINGPTQRGQVERQAFGAVE